MSKKVVIRKILVVFVQGGQDEKTTKGANKGCPQGLSKGKGRWNLESPSLDLLHPNSDAMREN
jgi:hypothetical protein